MIRAFFYHTLLLLTETPKYKFIFVFENSVCRDYIIDTLRYNIIPVVLGGGDYSYYIPKSCFVYALDFDRPESLPYYLKLLADDKKMERILNGRNI